MAGVEVGDGLALPFGDGTFDVVVNECAVGLMPDPQACLREMARVTKPGGFALIHESTWLKELPAQRRAQIASRLGTVPYALDEWRSMMERAGFVDVWTEDWSGPEKLGQIRPGRRVTGWNDLFSPWQKRQKPGSAWLLPC